MQFTCALKDLKARGYKFSKMYANNYHVYYKDFKDHRIWCWVAGRSIEIEDWYGQTENILEFYKGNKDKLNTSYGGEIILNLVTNEIRLFSYEEEFALYEKGVDARVEFYKDKRKIFLSKKSLDLMLEEIKYLTS